MRALNNKGITVNPRNRPLGSLFLIFLDGGIRGEGLNEGEAREIKVDTKKTVLKKLVYFSRNLFMKI